MKKYRWPLLAVLILSLSLVLVRYLEPEYKPLLLAGKEQVPSRALPEFSLKDTEGQDFTKQSLLGHWTVLYFGFTNCPDACPLALAYFKGELEKLTDEEKAKVQFLLLSVDPGHDTPEVLRSYVQKFHPGIRAATGAEDQLKSIASAFHAGFAKEQENPQDLDIYMMAHSPKYYLVNPKGEWQVVYDPPLKRGDLLGDLRQFLKQDSGEPMLW